MDGFIGFEEALASATNLPGKTLHFHLARKPTSSGKKKCNET